MWPPVPGVELHGPGVGIGRGDCPSHVVFPDQDGRIGSTPDVVHGDVRAPVGDHVPAPPVERGPPLPEPGLEDRRERGLLLRVTGGIDAMVDDGNASGGPVVAHAKCPGEVEARVGARLVMDRHGHGEVLKERVLLADREMDAPHHVLAVLETRWPVVTGTG